MRTNLHGTATRLSRRQGDKLVDLLFFAESFKEGKNGARKAAKDASDVLRTPFGYLFSMFIRDPRFGLGYREYGKILESVAGVTMDDMVLCGRYDDVLDRESLRDAVMFLYEKIKAGDNLAKKWMPRATSSNKVLASKVRKILGMSKQEYNRFIKTETVERLLTEKRVDEIDFSHVPSLASVKYARRFQKPDMVKRYTEYLSDVKSGKAKLNTAVTTVYDIYRNQNNIDADLFFNNIEKISLNCIPVIDTSGSMSMNDNIGKAVSIGHYLSMCSTYMPGKAITFSETPGLVDFTKDASTYNEQVRNIFSMDWGMSTNLKAVMDLLSQCDEFPEYIIILSDMEFNMGSSN